LIRREVFRHHYYYLKEILLSFKQRKIPAPVLLRLAHGRDLPAVEDSTCPLSRSFRVANVRNSRTYPHSSPSTLLLQFIYLAMMTKIT